MRAFVLKEPGVVGYVDVPEPKLTPYGAILRPVAVAPCSSDVHTVFGGGSRKAPNLVLGHECVAEVLKLSENQKREAYRYQQQAAKAAETGGEM